MATNTTDSNLSPDKRITYLVEGYIKENFLISAKYKYLSVSLLTNIFIKFLGNIFILFDIFPEKHRHEIKNDGKLIDHNESNGYFSIACSNGFNYGVHQIKVKCIEPESPLIGITNNYSQYTQDQFWPNDTDGEAYFYIYGGIHCGENSKKIFKQKTATEPIPGDVVKVIVDCNLWQLSIMDETVPIEPNNTYYFCMGIQSSPSKYELIP